MRHNYRNHTTTPLAVAGEGRQREHETFRPPERMRTRELIKYLCDMGGAEACGKCKICAYGAEYARRMQPEGDAAAPKQGAGTTRGVSRLTRRILAETDAAGSGAAK